MIGTRFFIVVFCLLVSVSGYSQKGKLLIGGSGNNRISLIDIKTKQVEWFHGIGEGEECNSVALTGSGNVLYAYKKGAKLIDRNEQVIWDYPIGTGVELHSASLLPDGGFLLGICGNPARIIELDKNGTVRKELSFDTRIKHPHSQFRQVVRSKSGNYLIPLMGRAEVIEIDADGTVIKTFKAEGNPFSVLELKNKNLLVGCGDAHLFLEIDRKTGEIIRKVNNEKVKGGEFCFIAQLLPLKKGNLLVCNWTGHSKKTDPLPPALLILDKNNRVVWSLDPKEFPGMISTAFIKE